MKGDLSPWDEITLTNRMKNSRLRIHRSLNRAEDDGTLRSLGNCHLFLLLVWSWGNTRAMEYRAVHDVIMCLSHHLRCSGEQALCAVHQPDAVTLNSQKTVKSSWESWAEMQGQSILLESCSQSNVSQSSHPRVFLSLQQPGQTDMIIFPKRDLTTSQKIQWGPWIQVQ